MSDDTQHPMSGPKQIEKVLFADVQEFKDPAARTAFLDQVCSGNEELRIRLEKLAALSETADEFFRLNSAGVAASPETKTSATATAQKAALAPGTALADLANTVIGRYKLLQRLGEGGCGVVYLAEQQYPLRRKVALKIIRLGMDTESVIARFEAERQTLALMDHPNIAHALDAGATDSGRPYFVMELVEGIKITDFCNQNHLDTRQRLELFIQICHAIQHAHQKGVIHRDIKPSNILVAANDGQPVPKVIDFGIAKATEGRLTDNSLHTAIDQFIGTPAYMSPEQAEISGLDVDTRSDIYSLGVLLYELLTGHTPFDSKNLMESGIDAMRRTLREREPQPPSTLLTTMGNTELTQLAVDHNAEPPRLISSVKGDLDWIVLKALDKDRRRRYETANGLAMDVQRYLNNEPVVARPPSNVYRLQKLVRRNRITFVAIAAVVVALLVGLSTSTWLFLAERQARRQAVLAEQQQARLRAEAERLRLQAEYHQNLTQATLLLSRDQMETADRQVADIPTPEPNLEYANLYRGLCDWHAVNSRWQLAAKRCAVLMQVNQPDDWDVTTLDYLRYAPLLLASGDEAGYDRFRHWAVTHFAGTTNPVSAERVLKLSLLTPPNADLLAALAPLAATAANSLTNVSQQDGWQLTLAAWRSFSLALMDYRQGNYAGVEHWNRKSTHYDNASPARTATFQIVLAMAHYRTGHLDQARSELAQARQTVDSKFINLPDNRDGGFWFDWVFARTLLREATTLMAPAGGG